MIDLYFWPTPNGQKISIFLEEAGLPYNVIPVNIGTGEQFEQRDGQAAGAPRVPGRHVFDRRYGIVAVDHHAQKGRRL